MPLIAVRANSEEGVFEAKAERNNSTLIIKWAPFIWARWGAPSICPSSPGSVKPPPEYWIRATQLMFRSLGINPEICRCGGRMKVKGSVTDATSIAEILTRLDLVPTGPPPKSVGELEIVYDI